MIHIPLLVDDIADSMDIFDGAVETVAGGKQDI
jgi:hypothetical protein